MLSYRHAYHAGNFADVLKHIIQVQILQHLLLKPKHFCYIDTHSGPGAYSLQDPKAEKTQEYHNGIAKLWRSDWTDPAFTDYLGLLKTFNSDEGLTHYPGSPWFAKQLMRANDRLTLFELHSTEIALLNSLFESDKRNRIYHRDGLSGAISQVPPIEKRGLILIDPSYEIKDDYQKVFQTIRDCYKRFSTGIYALWYPVVDRKRVIELENRFKCSGIKNIQLFELGIQADTRNYGMTSSGMIIINPPWTLQKSMQNLLPKLAQALSLDEQGHYRIESLSEE